MDESTKFYITPNTMESLFPDNDIKKLENLSLELIRKSSKLEGTVNPITRKALADFLDL